MNEIYEFIVSRGTLTDTHANDLKIKRGFTEETIKKYRFISACQENINLEKELLEKFTKEDLIKNGIFLKKDDSAHIDPILLQDRIIIPYLNAEGKTTLIRPHKLGLKSIEVQIFQQFNIIPDDKNLIITEGEFKAIAACQLGFSCVALPGVASFSGKRYQELITFLNENKINDICIIFDNEKKDDPALPNYKSDVMERYNTQYYALIMAKMLNKDGFTTRIGVLPDAWMQNGKIDIDGALAQGKTHDDLLGVIKRSYDTKEYFENLSDEAQEIVRKKEKKRFFKSQVFKNWGHYEAKRFQGKKEWEEVISNFTLKIVATHETIEGIIREIEITDEFGKSARFFSIGPEDMVGNDSFTSFCARHGNFIWKGRKEDLLAIWEQEFLNDSGRHIQEPDCIGWIPEKKIWLFGNVAFADKELRADDNGIFWTDKRGYKPVSLGVSSGKNMISEGVPSLTLGKCDFELIKAKLSESIGNFEACTSLGWAFSVLYMEDVFKLYGCFPFLFITGRRRSGKSTVAEWVMNLYGLENSGKQAADTTSVAMQRYMSYYSSLPFFVDEYRNDNRVTAKNGLMRNAYNRQSAGKGIKSDFGIREAKIRGTLIIAGEETPEDNALLTRCVVVNVSELKRSNNNFDWFVQNRNKLSAFTYDILLNREMYRDKFLSRLKEDKEQIAQKLNDERLAINKAVISAGYFSLFGDDMDFARDFIYDIKQVKIEQEAENAVSMFFSDLKALSFDKSFKISDYWSVSDGKIFIYFHGLYNVWAKDYQSRKREAPFKSQAIKLYLKDESGFLDGNYVHRLHGGVARCVVFDADKAPEFIKDLITA